MIILFVVYVTYQQLTDIVMGKNEFSCFEVWLIKAFEK